MKTKTFILLSLLICNLLPAQNVKLDIKPHFLGGCVKSKNQVFFDILYKKDFISLLC